MGSLRLRPPLDMLHFAPNWPDIQHCPVGFFGTPRGLGLATATTSAAFLPHCESPWTLIQLVRAGQGPHQ